MVSGAPLLGRSFCDEIALGFPLPLNKRSLFRVLALGSELTRSVRSVRWDCDLMISTYLSIRPISVGTD